MKHIFLYTVLRRDDPFYGFREKVTEQGGLTEDLFLSSRAQKHVQLVEYSERRYFRAFYYRSVFQELKQGLGGILSMPARGGLCVYIADEGVWAEMVKFIISKMPSEARAGVRVVSVQHGFFDVTERKSEGGIGRIVRRLLNRLSSFVLGFPIYGFGYGQSRLDGYFVYTDADKDYLLGLGNPSVWVVPNLIKRQFIKLCEDCRLRREDRRVLFVMPHFVKEPGYNLTHEKFWHLIAGLFRAFNRSGFEVVVRPHPGAERADVERLIAQEGLQSGVCVERECSIAEAIVKSSAILSFASTALFEAWLIGRLPVKVECNEYLETELTYPHAVIRLDEVGSHWSPVGTFEDIEVHERLKTNSKSSDVDVILELKRLLEGRTGIYN